MDYYLGFYFGLLALSVVFFLVAAKQSDKHSAWAGTASGVTLSLFVLLTTVNIVVFWDEWELAEKLGNVTARVSAVYHRVVPREAWACRLEDTRDIIITEGEPTGEWVMDRDGTRYPRDRIDVCEELDE